jgi:non-ribosomal peptide synthetase component E (peptide arylation enzyme)
MRAHSTKLRHAFFLACPGLFAFLVACGRCIASPQDTPAPKISVRG